MAVPTYDIDLLPPGSMLADVVGSAVEGGRSLSGITGTIDLSGGGLVQLNYNRIMLGTPQQHRYWNMLAARLRGGVNKAYVPILNDAAYPYPGDVYMNRPQGAGPYWIGTPFQADDLTRYQWFTGVLSSSAALNAGTIAVRTTDLRDAGIHRTLNPLALVGGEWFSINHGGSINHRSYRISEVDSEVVESPGVSVFTFGISPPLRAAANSGTSLRWWRPLCTMGLPPDESMPWIPNAGWYGEHSVRLIEKF